MPTTMVVRQSVTCLSSTTMDLIPVKLNETLWPVLLWSDTALSHMFDVVSCQVPLYALEGSG